MDFEQHLTAVVEQAVLSALRPYLRRLGQPEPLVYTVAQAAGVLQVSEDTIGRLVRRGVLAKLPHLESRVLIPRTQVDRLIAETDSTQQAVRRLA